MCIHIHTYVYIHTHTCIDTYLYMKKLWGFYTYFKPIVCLHTETKLNAFNNVINSQGKCKIASCNCDSVSLCISVMPFLYRHSYSSYINRVNTCPMGSCGICSFHNYTICHIVITIYLLVFYIFLEILNTRIGMIT